MKNGCQKPGLSSGGRFSAPASINLAPFVCQVGAKLEPNKMVTEVASTFVVDFEAKMEPKWSPKGTNMEAKNRIEI